MGYIGKIDSFSTLYFTWFYWQMICSASARQ